ncbi:MAG TPA: NTP transferase domain-containing protein [Clostridiales bacterium]|nr:NTP transferase domain-containing protein [Clostridiales bacterium]
MKNSTRPLKAVVLAAGKGTRLRTEGCDLPKVMRLAAGRPLLHYVLSAIDFIPREDIVLVVGYKKEQVTAGFPGYPYAEQTRQLGTGHAVMAACRTLPDYDGDLLVCCGDMPFIRRETYLSLINKHRETGAACTILTGTSSIDLPYGRIIRDSEGKFAGIVEDRDCTPEQKRITELNSSVYIFDAAALRSVLSDLRRDNAQGEYYLTDAPALMLARGLNVDICRRELGYEIIGVNTPEQLSQVESLLREQ